MSRKTEDGVVRDKSEKNVGNGQGQDDECAFGHVFPFAMAPTRNEADCQDVD